MLDKAWRTGFLGLHGILNIHKVMIAEGQYDWFINSIISDIKAFASWFYFSRLCCNSRILNALLYRLAKFGCSSRQDVNWSLAFDILLAMR